MNFKIPPNVIISFIESEFNSIKTTSSGEYRVNSPFANDTKHHLYINPKKGVVNDFKSGFSGSFIQFAKEFFDIKDDRNVIKILLENYSGKHIENIADIAKVISTLEIPDSINFFSEKKDGLIRNIAYDYLLNREIPEKNINELGYIYNEDSEYHQMIFVPFFENGNIVYFICRDYTRHNIKRYNNPLGLNSKEFVYNVDKIKENGDVFIFEGLFDALMLEEQVGTAMLSSDLGKKQAVKIIDKIPRNVIFVPDNDEAGKKSLQKNINLFLKYKPSSVDINVFVYYIGDAKDFGETGKHHIDIRECVEPKKILIDVKKFKRKEMV